MTNRRGEPGDWSQLERDFFASAPPDVPVQPPEPPRFDDLVAELRRPPRRAPRRRATDRIARRAARPRLEGSLRARVRQIVTGILTWARPRLEARLADGWRRLAAKAADARRELVHRTRTTFTRLMEEHPGERPDGKTLAVAIALVLVIVVSVSGAAPHAAPAARRGSAVTSPLR